MLDAYQAGDSTYQLAERFGVRRQTVAATLRRAGVATRGLERVELTDEQRAEARRLWAEGVSYHQIGIGLGVSERVVSRTLRSGGVGRLAPQAVEENHTTRRLT